MLILRNYNFLLLWIGQTLSQAGTRMYQIAIIWWIISRTNGGNGNALGWFLVAGALPSILFVKIVGKAVDKHKSKLILVLCDLLAFVFISAVYFLLINSKLTVFTACIAGFVVAGVTAFFDPTLNKALPELVKKEDMQSAVSFQSSTQYLASFGGAVAGGLLIDTVDISGVVLINAISYAVSALCNFIIKFTPVQLEKEDKKLNGNVSGWKILKGMPLLKRMLIGFGFVNFFIVPIFIVLPIYTKTTLSSTASVLGFLEAALWMGLLVGTFGAVQFDFIKSAVRIAVLSLLTFGACLLLSGIIVNKFFYASMLFTGGFAIGVNNARSMFFFQQTIDPAIKGRFFALLFALTGFTFPVSYLCFGFLADYFSPTTLCIIEGCGVLFLSIYFKKLEKQEEEYGSCISELTTR